MTASLDRPAGAGSTPSRPAGAPRRLRDRLPGTALLAPESPAPSRPAFAWRSTAVNAWILSGLFVDGYFHIHDPDLESFFTPWHALLYSGVAAAVVILLLEVRRQGHIPDGYLPSAVGGLVVGVAGVVDGVWHTVLGVEADLAALLSPPHLLLIVAGTLVFAGPLRAALRTRDRRLDLPAALSVAAVVTGLGFFTQYANPYTQLFATSQPFDEAGPPVTDPALLDLRQVAGLTGLVVFVALVAAAVALLRARTSVPTGALGVAVAVPALAMTTLHGTYAFVPGILLSALLVDVLARRIGPALGAALTGASLSLTWVLTLLATEDVVWGAELLTGAIGSAAAAGYLVGWLVQDAGISPAQ